MTNIKNATPTTIDQKIDNEQAKVNTMMQEDESPKPNAHPCSAFPTIPHKPTPPPVPALLQNYNDAQGHFSIDHPFYSRLGCQICVGFQDIEDLHIHDYWSCVQENHVCPACGNEHTFLVPFSQGDGKTYKKFCSECDLILEVDVWGNVVRTRDKATQTHPKWYDPGVKTTYQFGRIRYNPREGYIPPRVDEDEF